MPDEDRDDDTGAIKVVLRPTQAAALRLPVAAWIQGAAAGASVAGPVCAYAFHREIPKETFEWIIANGVQGLLLVAVFVVGSAYAWQIRDRLKLETERREEAKSLLREQLSLVAHVTRSKDRSTAALERVALALEKLDLVTDDEDNGDEGRGGSGETRRVR